MRNNKQKQRNIATLVFTQPSIGSNEIDAKRDCELDRFLTEFKFEFMSYLQVRVQVLRILFFEFKFEFGENDRVQRVQV